METILSNFLHWAGDNVIIIIAILAIFVEITPIKINPIRGLLKWLGKYLTQYIKDDNVEIKGKLDKVETRINELDTRIDALEENADINELDRIRWEILNFSNSCRNNIRHTKDEFCHIITLNSKYEALLKKHDMTNGYFEEEYKFILKIYHKCQDENDFL